MAGEARGYAISDTHMHIPGMRLLVGGGHIPSHESRRYAILFPRLFAYLPLLGRETKTRRSYSSSDGESIMQFLCVNICVNFRFTCNGATKKQQLKRAKING